MANATSNDQVDQVEQDDVQDDAPEVIQPDRYVESDAHVPNGTDQYGVVLTNGAANLADGIQYATPLLREHRLGLENEDVTQDEYFLTPGQREAAEVMEPGTSDADRGTQSPGEGSAVTGVSNYASSGKSPTVKRESANTSATANDKKAAEDDSAK